MLVKTLKKTLESAVLTASLALAPVSAKAITEKELNKHTPPHMQTIFDNKSDARAAVLGFNVLYGCVKSGVGSYVNDKSFFEGCAKGALAGSVMYAGEYLASYNRYPMVGAAGKLVHDWGVSMSDNVMRGEDMLSQYQTKFGPVIFTFRDSIVPSVSFTLTPVVGIVANIADGQRFDFEQTLYNFTPVFQKPLERMMLGGQVGFVPGYTRGNVISYTPLGDLNGMTLSHEFNHVLFWSKWRFCSDLLNWVPKMEDIQEWWNVGQDVSNILWSLPLEIDERTYYYQLLELEAYSMQRM